MSSQSNDELRELYRELILDHARSPRHFGKLPAMTHTAEGINPLCGDKLKLYLEIDGNERISDAAFEGSGCAISVASASLLTDTVIGMQQAAALDYAASLIGALKGNDTDAELGKLRALEGVREFPSRVKCATLAWHAMQSAIEHDRLPASTE
jgi:nitrogen fixation protein NifU and related proteins